ncbi:hypothetical protein PPTG_11191 [Phytophthora nicotianae INRA-310]|uniref:Uncharacterized protein n=1 Tax=Phytophthora nicotianae (strain INRA-310) TaxID=761204 RepID=W2Q8G9_PHYN3|nr:hypothetical protein PPTG_11191 [Phytophthora nicotianae INRA-310]ETN09166.1 hypothetical protein PPTG_11191 [Phytophthora nicotianae INRA-310]
MDSMKAFRLWVTTTDRWWGRRYQLDPENALTASHLFSDRAQTAIKERDFAAALQDATQALKYNASNEKAILRKLVALENLERFESALQLANDVLDNG